LKKAISAFENPKNNNYFEMGRAIDSHK